MARTNPPPAREPLTNWERAPCPRCGSPLRYRGDLPSAQETCALVLLVCEHGHHWQERMNLRTLHSGVFVERREDLERAPVPVRPPRHPAAEKL